MNPQIESTTISGIGPDRDQFRNDVLRGLLSEPKRLDSKYLYDSRGDELFQQIMRSPEYYLTKCELDIFRNQTEDLVAEIAGPDRDPFDLIELGVGNGEKTKYLLQELVQEKFEFNYRPIDISGNVLSQLKQNLSHLSLRIHDLQGEYLEALKQASSMSRHRKVVLFLGANIGNLGVSEARRFCKSVRNLLRMGDLFLVGFDLKKNPQVILDAYNDKQGITRDFNLNLLARINRELNADFDLRQFFHYPTYDPESGACKSYLVSTIRQKVKVGDVVVPFAEGEWIFVEVSQKYALREVEAMASNTGFSVQRNLLDSRNWFVDSIWTAVPL